MTTTGKLDAVDEGTNGLTPEQIAEVLTMISIANAQDQWIECTTLEEFYKALGIDEESLAREEAQGKKDAG